MIASNHQALYTQILAVSVLYLLSIKVPVAIAIAKPRNKTAINRVENKNENIFFSMYAGITNLKSPAKVDKKSRLFGASNKI